MSNASGQVPSAAQSAVLVRSDPLPEDTPQALGPQFDTQDPRDTFALMNSMGSIGFQGTSVAEAVRIIERMVRAPYSLSVPGALAMIPHSK